MSGDLVFLVGAGLEIWGLVQGVHPWAVATSLIVYGGVLLCTGYLR